MTAGFRHSAGNGMLVELATTVPTVLTMTQLPLPRVCGSLNASAMANES